MTKILRPSRPSVLPVGRVTTVTDPDDRVTSYTYDALGRVLTVTLPSVGGRSFVTSYSYDHLEGGSGLLYTHVTDPNGRVTKLGYDQFGRLIRSEDAAGKATLYAYTTDRLTSITDANGNRTGYVYDTAGRLAKTVFPDLAEESYTYHPDGLLKTKTDRRGVTVTYGYDALKRLVEKVLPEGKRIDYVYDGEKLVSVVDGTVTPAETHAFAYDGELRVTGVTQGPRGTVSYTYDEQDRVMTTAIASGPTATQAYNADGSLRSIGWSPVAGSFGYAYTASGQYETVAFPNGQQRSYAYDAQGRLTQIENVMGPATLARYGYGYDVDAQTGQPTQLGQRTSQTATLPAQGLAGATTTYGYDALYQLTRAQYPSSPPFNGETHVWTYDDIGNRLTAAVNADVTAYTYLRNGQNPLNGQKLEKVGLATYGYDANGNTTSRFGDVFGYDLENRLTSVQADVTATYTYDYQGRRTTKTVNGTTTSYLYDGLNLIAETTAGQPSYFLNGPGIDEPIAMARAGSLSYFSVDGLGSVVATNDPAGTVTHSVVFDAWGNVKAESGTRAHPFTYTGREVGEAGLHFYRARYYQPGVGRFTQEDPVRHEPASASYRYASGQPLTSTDPLGLYTMRENCKCIKDNDPFKTGLVSQENVRQQAEGAIRIMRSTSCSRVLKAAGVFDVMMKVLTPGVAGTEVSCGARVDMGSAPGGYTPYNRKSRKPNAGVLFLSATAFNNYAGRTMFHEAVHAAGWDTNIPSWRSIFRTCLEAGSQEADLDYIDVGYDPSALLEAGVPE